MTLKSLQQYGKGFQFMVLGSLLTDKMFLLNDCKMKNIPATDTSNVMAKSDALFFTFFGSIKCFK